MGERTTLTFLGGAGTVTGSKYLVRAGPRAVLLECGLFQGLKALRLRNWAPPGIAAESVDAVVLSHAHLDHSGYLPILARAGFRGPVHCTPATADLLRVLFLDAAKLAEEEAARANRYGYSKHHPALPLFTATDAERALALVAPRRYGDAFAVAPGATARFRRAGHILGAATVELAIGGTTLAFSGDLGRWGRPILRDPELVPRAQVVLVESTYGDRVHPPDVAGALARIVREAVSGGGVLLIPAFAVGRAQELLSTLGELEDAGRIPIVPVYLDSPMASDVTAIYGRHPEDHDLDMARLVETARPPLETRRYRLVRTPEESKALNAEAGPMVVISASGMATGGRILHHLKRRLPDPSTTVLLAGFQAEGTRGRKLQEGAATLRIHGEDVPVRAAVRTLDGMSAHADRDDLLRWLAGFEAPPRRVHVVHGEPRAAAALVAAVRTRFGWTVDAAVDGATVSLD